MIDAPVNTAKVQGRRELTFRNLGDLSADLDLLERAHGIKTLGNWTPGQIAQHLALIHHQSIDGFSGQLPWIVRKLLAFFMKNKILNTRMSAGFKLPKTTEAELVPSADTPWPQALAYLREGIRRSQSETRRVESPFLGPLTVDEWNRLHCRHAELHLSFLIPE